VLAAILGEAADDGVIVGEAPIAVELVEAGEQALDVIERVRPVGMAGDQDPLPRRQLGVELDADLVGPLLQRLD
jgi:hypothetical protein